MEPMEKYQGHDEKEELHHVEDGKIVTDVEPTALQQGGLDTLSEGRNPWKVLLENPKALALIMAVQSNAIIVGVEFSLPGNLLGITAFNKLFGVWSETDGKYAVEAKVLTIWGALFATFQVLGQFTGGECNDRFGRRLTLYSVIFFTMIGVMLEVIATTWQMWLGSKIVIGFATGIMQATVPCYVTEVSPREIRGIMLSFFNMAMNIGGLAATVIPWATNKRWPGEDDLRSFRVPLYVALAAPVLTLIAEVFLLVESPYWLMMKGRKEQARKALAFINPKSSEVDLDRAVAVLEYTLEKEAEANEQHRNTTYLDCFKGVDLRRTFCAVFPPISQNLTGQNLVGTYATYFFVIAKQSDPLISSVITTSVGLASNFISFFLIENKRIGRWMLLFVGIIVMTLCMLGLGITDVVAKSDFSQAQGSVLVALVSIFLAASTIGPGVAGWAYTGESGSSRLRAKTTTLGTVGNAIVGLIMTSVLPYLLSADSGAKWGVKTAFLFAGLGAVCIVIIYLFVPDYTGRTFAMLDELFYRRIPARRFSKTECTGEYGNEDVGRA